MPVPIINRHRADRAALVKAKQRLDRARAAGDRLAAALAEASLNEILDRAREGRRVRS